MVNAAKQVGVTSFHNERFRIVSGIVENQGDSMILESFPMILESVPDSDSDPPFSLRLNLGPMSQRPL